ncbi:MAG: 50S ribosomal protein L24 [Alphaproteobacteria bacterium]|jgi:large subunit ribosomal protein L24
MANKIKKGDQVIVTTGRDKGKTGEVIRSMPKEGKVIVQGLNMVKCHTRPSQTSAGGIISKEAPIDVSNVALVDPASGKATRVGFKVVDGAKVRYAKRSGEVITDKK